MDRSRTEKFMEALGTLEQKCYHSCCSNDHENQEESVIARAKVVATFQDNIIVQSDDILLECYRIAVAEQASDDHLKHILSLIAKEKGIR